MIFIVTYRNEFEARIQARSVNEAVEKFEKGECEIERSDRGGLWRELIDVYKEVR